MVYRLKHKTNKKKEHNMNNWLVRKVVFQYLEKYGADALHEMAKDSIRLSIISFIFGCILILTIIDLAYLLIGS